MPQNCPPQDRKQGAFIRWLPSIINWRLPSEAMIPCTYSCLPVTNAHLHCEPCPHCLSQSTFHMWAWRVNYHRCPRTVPDLLLSAWPLPCVMVIFTVKWLLINHGFSWLCDSRESPEVEKQSDITAWTWGGLLQVRMAPSIVAALYSGEPQGYGASSTRMVRFAF